MIISHGRTWLTLLFLVPWALLTLVFDAITALTFAGGTAGGVPLGLFLVLFLLPFNAVAVASWAALVSERRDRRSAAGIGRPTHARDRWTVTLPSGRALAASIALSVLPILGVFALLFAFGTVPPPWWGTTAAIGVVAAVAAWAYRVWGFRPVVVIDEKRQAVTFRTARGREDSALWVAVKELLVFEMSSADEDGESLTGYAVRVKLEGKGGTRFVMLYGRREREPVERFAAWLRERLKPADKGGSPTAPPVH
jgi:hypothetical protein